MNKNIGWVIGIVVVVLIVIALLVWSGAYKGTSSGAGGRVYVSFSDAAADMNAISEITMRVSEVDLYSSTRGWVALKTSSVDYPLLTLRSNGEARLYSGSNVAAETYTRVRVIVDRVTVEPKNKSTETATLPSKTFEAFATVVVENDAETSVNLDVMADKSLQTTTKGAYVFAPVIRIESRSNAEITETANGTVDISDGVIDTATTFGMNVDGAVNANFELPSNVKLDIGAGGTIEIIGGASTILQLQGDAKAQGLIK